MEFQRRWGQLLQKHDAIKFCFLNVELELASTYCEIAAATTDLARSRRNISNAERAYTTATYFLDGIDAAQKPEIDEELLRLRLLCDETIDTILERELSVRLRGILTMAELL